MPDGHRSTSANGRRGQALVHLVGVLAAVAVLTPLVWALITSFKPANELFDLTVIADHPTLDNYRVAVDDFPLRGLLIRSFVTAAAVTVGQCVLAVTAGFAFAVLRPRGGRLLFALVVITLLIPQQCLMIPNYIVATRLGWLDSYVGLIVPQLGLCGLGIVLVRQHIEAIPASVLDAARLDGATDDELLLRVVAPSIRPALGALAILVFVTTWNEYLWPLLIAPTTRSTTIQVGLRAFLTEQGSAYGPLMAAALIACIPVVAVYLVQQRRIVDTLLHAGVR